MKIDRNQAITLILLSFIFFYLGFSLAGCIFLGLGSLKIEAYYNNPLRKLIEKIKENAKSYQVLIPKSQEVQEKMINMYQRLEVVDKNSPELSEQYHKIIDAFWSSAINFTNKEEWNRTLSQVLRNWPTIHHQGKNQLLGALDDAQKAALDLEKVRQEVYS